jgi:hypothetical protein
MALILDSLPSKYDHRILCDYVNATSQIQIIRIANIPSWYFERVVFPKQRLLFAAPTQAQLEVYTSEFPATLLVERIACERLRASDDLPCFLKHN